jgi:hypothetical protein
MRHCTFSNNKSHRDIPNGVSVLLNESYIEILFDMNNLEHVNFVRQDRGKSKLDRLDGYCMSSGCSCRHQNGSKGRPDCGLWKANEEDGIKKDFIYQILGI